MRCCICNVEACGIIAIKTEEGDNWRLFYCRKHLKKKAGEQYIIKNMMDA